jgi:hypothetical protein
VDGESVGFHSKKYPLTSLDRLAIEMERERSFTLEHFLVRTPDHKVRVREVGSGTRSTSRLKPLTRTKRS